MRHLGAIKTRKSTADVLVTVFDPAIEGRLRNDDPGAETGRDSDRDVPRHGQSRQSKSSTPDKLEIPIVLLYGPDEKAKGVVTIKDMSVGRARAQQLTGSRDQWLHERPGQFEVPRQDLVNQVKELIAKIGEPALRILGVLMSIILRWFIPYDRKTGCNCTK